eukprot:Amastigsp_a339963_1738.p1 type:complete len:281 gc:universal Amastigsp_a339963_1738:856-14(-)
MAAAAIQRIAMRVAVGALGIGTTAFALEQSLYTVEAGSRAVIFNRWSGVQDNVVGEGTHFMIPLFQRPIFFSVRSKPREIPSRTGTKDLQDVQITLRLLYRPLEEALPAIYNTYGEDYDERIMPSIGNEVLKAIVAQYDAIELITQREKVSQTIRDALTRDAARYSIVLDDISITHLSFSRDFTSAVERKQVAQQDAERQKWIVEKDEYEKRASVIRAEGESQAAQLISDAYKQAGTAHLELRRIETAQFIAETLGRSRNVTYVPSGGNIFLSMGGGGPK